MGTFLWYIGDENIPEERRAEFFDRVKTVLNYGGMMGVDIVNIYGKKLSLLRPAEEQIENVIDCWYNYFEDSFWESAGIRTDTPRVFSGKVGWNQFNAVMRAVYQLQEIYSKGFGMLTEDGDPIGWKSGLGWLNYLFDESYTNERVAYPWRVWRLFCDNDDEGYFRLEEVDIRDIPDWVDNEGSFASLYSFLLVVRPDLLNSATSEVQEETSIEGESERPRLVTLERSMWRALLGIADDVSESTEQKLSRIKDILKSPQTAAAVSEASGSEYYRSFATLSNSIPVPISVRLVAKKFSLEFWDLYNEVRDGDDARANLYDSDISKPSMSPVPKLTTEEYTFSKGDDRAYWWSENGDVTFSDEMNHWLSTVRQELDELSEGKAAYENRMAFLQDLTDTLSGFVKNGRRLLMFRETFDELIMNWKDERCQSAVVRLKRFLDELIEAETPDETAVWIRRYLAVLANPCLRKQVFGF